MTVSGFDTRTLIATSLMHLRILFLVAAITLPFANRCVAKSPTVDTGRGDAMIAEYFFAETNLLSARCLDEIKTLQDWTSRRETYRQQLLEMLGLDPMPARSPLRPVITGSIETEELIVENLHFQSLPGLYVTANLYRPAKQDKPLPAILYVCGHGGVKKDGISLGNKTHYQHHGAWFARNGYVCLTIDTIQLGELEGIHHGTYREGMWWWNNRGYTPAGVEAWNCLRSLDYLQSRTEVDGQRIGVTGRSGGGAYSWWIAAIDDRIKVTVPVAGITSLKNHVIDGCVEGHCDCMFTVNTYRWDYPMVAALVAPRPLLISNTDKDRIFPLDGVLDVHSKVRRIYELYDAGENLGLQITEGPHKDTQELRVHAFRWFNRFLKQKDDLLQSPATPFFEQQDLKVFDTLPKDERVTTIHETFVPAVSVASLPRSRSELDQAGSEWMKALREKTFRGWPALEHAPTTNHTEKVVQDGFQLSKIEFESQKPFRLQMLALSRNDHEATSTVVHVLTQSEWESCTNALAIPFPNEFPKAEPDRDSWRKLEASIGNGVLVLVVPRGVGPTEWSRDEKSRTHIRRRFMLLGQTLAGMQTYDVLRALQLIVSSPELSHGSLRVNANGEAATWTLFASLFANQIDQLDLTDLPIKNRDAPDMLNVSRFVELPQIAMLAASRTGSFTLQHSDNQTSQAWDAICNHNPFASQLIQRGDTVDPD